MDLETTVIGAIIVIICVLPFISMGRNRKKREKQMLFSLEQMAQKHNTHIGLYEFNGDFAIAFDPDFNFVFFFKQKMEEAISHTVILSEIHSCRVDKGIRNANNKGQNVTIIERVSLSYSPKNKRQPEMKHAFFNEENMQLSGELELAEKWAKQINEHLNHSK